MNRIIVSLAFVTILIVSGFIISCEDDKNNTNPKSDAIVFEGITVTDSLGKVTKNDPTDWKLTDIWTDKEDSLFSEKKVNSCNTGDFSYSISPYPNPCGDRFNLHISKPAETRLAFRIVDRNYKVLLSLDSVFVNGLAIDVKDFNITNDTVRIYYKFLGLDCELKGHGDILIK